MKTNVNWVLGLSFFMITGCASVSDSKTVAHSQFNTQLSTEFNAQWGIEQLEHSTKFDQPVIEFSQNPERQLMKEYLLGKMAARQAERVRREGGDDVLFRQYLDVAVENLVSASQSMDDLDLIEQSSRAAIVQKDYDNAQRAAQHWVNLTPDSMKAHYFFALASIKKADEDKAMVALRDIIRLSETPEMGLADVGNMLSQEESRQPSVNLMEKIASEHPDNPTAYYTLALVTARFDGGLEQALTALDEVLIKDAQHFDAIMLKASLLQKQGKSPEALALLKRAVEQAPDDAELRYAYARTLVTERRYTDARDQYEILYEQDPQNLDLAFRLGILSLELRQPDAAEDQFKQVLRGGVRASEAIYYLGRVYEMKGDYKQALERYRQVADGEFRLDALLREARVLARLDRVEEAIASITRLQSVNQDTALDIRFTLSKVDIWMDKQEYSKAHQALNQALEHSPDAFDLLYARSMVVERLGNVDQALADLRTLLEQQPDNPDVMNALGYTLANKTQQYDEAYELIARALSLKPDSAAVMDSMGWVLYRMGKLNEAESYLRQAYEMEADPEIAAHLGEVLWKQGQEQQAKMIWNKALQQFPQHKLLREVLGQFVSDQYAP